MHASFCFGRTVKCVEVKLTFEKYYCFTSEKKFEKQMYPQKETRPRQKGGSSTNSNKYDLHKYK